MQSERDVAAATIGSYKADLKQRELDLGFTKVLAPVSGRVSRMLVTEGNLVQSGEIGGGTLESHQKNITKELMRRVSHG